jgi:hypothetical protein
MRVKWSKVQDERVRMGLTAVMDTAPFVLLAEAEQPCENSLPLNLTSHSLQLVSIWSYILGSSIDVTLQGVGGLPAERDM